MGDPPDGLARDEIESVLARQRRVLEMTGKVIWHVDLHEMTVTYFGPVEELTGIPADDLDDPLLVNPDAIHPADQKDVFDAHESLLHGDDERLTVTFRTNPETGDVRWIRNETFVADPDAERPGTLLGIATDVTDADPPDAEPPEVGRAEIGDLDIESAGLKALLEDLLAHVEVVDRTTDVEAVDLAALAAECWDRVETEDATLSVETEQTFSANAERVEYLLETLFRFAASDAETDATVTVGDLADGFVVEYECDDSATTVPDELAGHAESTKPTGTRLGLLFAWRLLEAEAWDLDVVDDPDSVRRFEIRTADSDGTGT